MSKAPQESAVVSAALDVLERWRVYRASEMQSHLDRFEKGLKVLKAAVDAYEQPRLME